MPLELRVFEIILVYLGLSYRKVAQIISVFQEVSCESVRKWNHGDSYIFSMTVEHKKRHAIAIDETKIEIKSEDK